MSAIQFENKHRPIKHSCKRENVGFWWKQIYLGNPYIDEKDNEYPNLENLQNRMSRPEIEIQKSQRKRKKNILSHVDEECKLNKQKLSSNKQKKKELQKHSRGKRGGSRSRTSTYITHIFNV